MSDESVDVYADQFSISSGAFGASLNFLLTPQMPPGPGVMPMIAHKATIRMSPQLMKMLAFLIHRQVHWQERELGAPIVIGSQTLNESKIGPEDWETFWKK